MSAPTTAAVDIAPRHLDVLCEPVDPDSALAAAGPSGRFEAVVPVSLEAYVSGRARPLALDRYLARLLVVGSSTYGVVHRVEALDPAEDMIFVRASIDMRQMRESCPERFAA